MKIAYLSGAYVPSRGANSMHVMRMCQAMARLGHDVTLHVRPGEMPVEGDYSFYGVEPIFRIAKHQRPSIRGLGAAVNAWHVSRALRGSHAPDLIYAREVWALVLASTLDVPFVFESHWAPRDRMHLLAERHILRHQRLQRAVFISDGLRNIYQQRFPWLDRKKTVVAHDGADPEQACAVDVAKSLGRPGALQVGYVGSFQAGCGVEMIYDLACQLGDVDFHVFGGSEAEIRPIRERAVHLSNLMLHGFQPPMVLGEAYAGLDVVVAPYQPSVRSLAWMSPMKLFEYMAHGKAIVCSDFPVLREILTHDETALLVDAEDTAAWAQAIRRLRDNLPVRRRLGEGARRCLESQFTWSKRAATALEGLT